MLRGTFMDWFSLDKIGHNNFLGSEFTSFFVQLLNKGIHTCEDCVYRVILEYVNKYLQIGD